MEYGWVNEERRAPHTGNSRDRTVFEPVRQPLAFKVPWTAVPNRRRGGSWRFRLTGMRQALCLGPARRAQQEVDSVQLPAIRSFAPAQLSSTTRCLPKI